MTSDGAVGALRRGPTAAVLGVLVVAACLLAGCTSGKPTASSADKPTLFDATDAGFTAEFPSKPERKETVAGLTTQVTYEALSPNAAEDVIVQYLATPGPLSTDPQTLLDKQMDGAAADVTGTVVSRSNLTFLGHQAEDGLIKSPKGNAIRMRAFFVPAGNVEQYFVCSGGAATIDVPHPAYDRLLATFKLNP